MSTNYNFIPNETSPLYAYGEIHIGKQSGGWVFNFHGYDIPGGVTRVEVDRCSGLTVSVNVVPFVVKSAEQWRSILVDGTIKNEYGETITFDDFWNNRISGPKETLRNHSKMYLSDQNWIDSEGYSFSGYVFS